MAEARDERLIVLVTGAEKDAIASRAAERKISVAEYVRGCINAYAHQVPSEDSAFAATAGKILASLDDIRNQVQELKSAGSTN